MKTLTLIIIFGLLIGNIIGAVLYRGQKAANSRLWDSLVEAVDARNSLESECKIWGGIASDWKELSFGYKAECERLKNIGCKHGNE